MSIDKETDSELRQKGNPANEVDGVHFENNVHDTDRHENDTDDKLTSFGKTLKKILSGDMLARDAIKSQTGAILLVAFFIILCTSNRYSCQQSHIKEEELKKELSDAKNRAFSSFSLLTEKSRKSKLLDGLKAMNDSSLQVAEQPPYIVEVPQKETDD